MQESLKYQLIAELLHSLEVEGYQFGIGKHLQLQQLLERLPENVDPNQLAFVLIPVLATNELEQEHFYELFEQCKLRVAAVHERVPVSPIVKQERRLKWWLVALITILILLSIPPLYYRITPEPPPTEFKSFTQINVGKPGLICLDSVSLTKISPIISSRLCDLQLDTSVYGRWSLLDSSVCLQYMAKDSVGLDSICVVLENETGHLTMVHFLVEVTQPITLTPSEELFIQKPDPPQPDLSVLIFQPANPFVRFHQQNAWWLKPLFIILLGLLFYAIMRWRELRRRKVVAELQNRDKPPYVWNIDLDDDDDVDLGDYFQPLLNRLRQRTTDDFVRLDIPLTVSATIEKAGMVDFRYLQQTRPPEYLMLIDQQHVRNHRARLFDLLYQAFKENEIYVERFFYKGDPRLAHNEAYPDGLTLKELQHRFPNARFLMIGNGYQLLSNISGKLVGWTRIFEQWPLRSLLTPQPPAIWGRRENRLSERFQVLPASVQSLYYLVDQFDAGEDADWGNWEEQIKDIQMEPIRFDGGLMETLRQVYPPEMLRWIAACAIYPSLHWDLTLYLGRQFSTPEYPLLTVENILNLVRLPWFAEGQIPELSRALLLDDLEQRDPALLDHMREALHTALQKSAPPSGSAAWEDYRMNVAINEWLFTKDKAKKKALEKEVADMMEKGAEADFAVLKYLDRERSPLDFIVPDRWKKYVHPGGYSGLGWKGLMKDLMYWALPLWLLLSAFGIWYSPEANECTGKRVVFTSLQAGESTSLELCLENPEEELVYFEAEIRNQLHLLKKRTNPLLLMINLNGRIDEGLALEVADTLKQGFRTRIAAVIHNAGLPYYFRSNDRVPAVKDTACLFFSRALALDSTDQDYLRRMEWCDPSIRPPDLIAPEALLNNQDSLETTPESQLSPNNYQIKVLQSGIASPRKEMTGRIGNVNITMTYGSMTIRGRSIWGGLVTYDKIWRTGANEATTFEIDRDVWIEGQPLPAGKYGLFTIPGQSQWTIIFNSVWNQWGAYDYDASDDVLRVEVSSRKLSQLYEEQDFIIENNEVVHRWERLAVPFRVSSATGLTSDLNQQNPPSGTQANQDCYSEYLQRGERSFEVQDYERAIQYFKVAEACVNATSAQRSEITSWIDRTQTTYLNQLKAALAAEGGQEYTPTSSTKVNTSIGGSGCYTRFLQKGQAFLNAQDYESALQNFKAAKACMDASAQNSEITSWIDRTFTAYVEALKAARKKAENDGEETTGQASNPTISYGSVIGPDKKRYKTINLAGKTWLAENLNIEAPDSGCYEDDPVNCEYYGRLYTWAAAKEACQALGPDWRLPSDEEWKALAQSFGGYYDAEADQEIGDSQKALSELVKGGSSGFSALLGPYMARGSLFTMQADGYYWSATESDASNAWEYIFRNFGSRKLTRDKDPKSTTQSCRCLKD